VAQLFSLGGSEHNTQTEHIKRNIMKLRTVTLFAAIALLLANICMIASDIRTLIQLATGHMEWKENWLFIVSMPFYLLSWIAINVFLFTLAAKQKQK
jgi:hypothetical protein